MSGRDPDEQQILCPGASVEHRFGSVLYCANCSAEMLHLDAKILQESPDCTTCALQSLRTVIRAGDAATDTRIVRPANIRMSCCIVCCGKMYPGPGSGGERSRNDWKKDQGLLVERNPQCVTVSGWETDKTP